MAYTSLEIGKRALLANRFGIDVSSNNIANVNTPGYSRRAPIFQEATTYFSSGNFNGTGVMVDKLRTYREEFFDREVRNTFSRQSAFSQDEKIFQRMETIFAEPSDLGIGDVSTDFFNAFKELSLKPESVGLRENLLGIAETLTERIRTTALQLNEARTETFQSIKSSVQQANRLIQEVADLNNGFSGTKRLASEDAQTMIDQREAVLEELSKLADLKVTPNEDGTINVFLNGISVVTQNIPSKLEAREVKNSDGEVSAKIVKVDKNGNVLNTISPTSGELASYIKHFNVTLDHNESSNEFSAAKELNDFAGAIMNRVNSVMSQGYGLDDFDDSNLGKTFFSASGEDYSLTITLSEDVRNKPREIALSDSPGEPGNSEVARKLAQLQNNPTFIDNTTPVEYYAAFIGKLGSLAKEAKNGSSTTRLVSEQLVNQREAIIGVSLDEEAINIVKFQQAFQASSQIVNTANEVLQTIVNLGR